VAPAGILPAENKLNQARRPVAPQAECLATMNRQLANMMHAQPPEIARAGFPSRSL